MTQIKNHTGFSDIPGWRNYKPKRKTTKVDMDRSKYLMEHPIPAVKAWLDKFEFSDTKNTYKKD